MTFLAATTDQSGTPPAARLPALLKDLLENLADSGYALDRVLAVPPDITRLHSGSGEVLSTLADILGDRLSEVIPAVGTHAPMTEREIRRMYPGVPMSRFRNHNYRTDVDTLGSIDAAFIEEQSEGKLSFEWPAQISRRITSRDHGLVLSIGQVVPHEVAGMANHAKNIFIGTGGAEAISRSHYLGAVYGMERIMGVADNPVRRVLNRAAREFTGDLPIVYILTVVGTGSSANPPDDASSPPDPPADAVASPGETPCIVGLFAGDDEECFYQAAELSRKHNVIPLERAPATVVVSLDPESYRSTWLGNKAIYRTRKAIADGGELFVYAPGVREFGEDPEIDRLIRSHGYCNTENVLAAVDGGGDLAGNLGAAAHLIHGSTEGRFSVTYAPGHLDRTEIEGVGYRYADPKELAARFRFSGLRDGWNDVGGREIYFISQPGLGLWEAPDRGAR
jgi:nickel-dependent lactate racemase